MGMWDANLPISWQPLGGRATFGEIYDAAREAAVYVSNGNARVAATERAIDDINDRIFAETGQRLENPLRQQDWALSQRGANAYTEAEMNALAGHHIAAWEAERQRILAERPELADLIGGPVEDEVNRVVREADERIGAYLASRYGVAGYGAMFAGGFVGAFRDPLQTALMIAGGGAGAARTVGGRILSAFGREAAINATIEAGLQPLVQSNRARAGLEAGFGMALRDIAMAALVGGAFGGGAQGLAEGARAVSRYMTPDAPIPAPVRGAIAAIETDDAIARAAPEGVDAETHDVALARAVEGAEDVRRMADARPAVERAVEPELFDALPDDPNPVVVSTAPLQDRAAEGTLRDAARQYALDRFRGRTVVNEADESAIAITADGIRKGTSGRRSEAELAAVEKLDEVLERMRPLGSRPDREGRPSVRAVHNYQADIVADGRPARLRVVVREAPDGRRYYWHMEVLRGEAGSPMLRAAPSTGVGPSQLEAPRGSRRPNAAPSTGSAAPEQASGGPAANISSTGAGGKAMSSELADAGRRPVTEPFEPDQAAEQTDLLLTEIGDRANATLPDGTKLEDGLADAKRLDGVAALIEACRLG